jgi:hypothetical protein
MPRKPQHPDGPPRRYDFFLNPYEEERFTRCPRCARATRLRRLALLVLFGDTDVHIIDHDGRLCERCELIVVHQHDLEQLMLDLAQKEDLPHLVGLPYIIPGILARRAWRFLREGRVTIEDVLDQVTVFKEQVSFDYEDEQDEVEEPWFSGDGSLTPEPAEPQLPAALQRRVDEIADIAERVSAEYLDDEYAALARQMADRLAWSSEDIERGQARSWAAGILHALGRVNYLFDPTQTPHMKSADLAEKVGVSPATASSYARRVTEALSLTPLNFEWYRPSKLEDNPLAWYVLVDGLIVDIRTMPLEVQEEALRQGLIPYLPGRRDSA